MTRFHPEAMRTFRFTGHDWDETTTTARLRYALDHDHAFEETIRFHDAPAERHTASSGFEAAVRILHLLAGVSYYKAAAPPLALAEAGPLTTQELEVAGAVYDAGLREFAVRNSLPVPTGPRFDGAWRAGSPAVAAGLPARDAIPLGGGKDSTVVVDALAGLGPLLLTVNSNQTTEAVAARSGLDYVRVERTISPHLLDLNRRGARNGHVPVTAIVSAIAVAGAFVYGYDTVLMANGASSSAPTRVVDGVPVNHQWSKSAAFEEMFAGLVATHVAPDLRYLSVLRPYSELAIGRALAGAPRFHDVFQSCNTNFVLDGVAAHGWCGDCAKCRFVFLMLAPFMERAELVAIFGRDLLAAEEQLDGFRRLLDPDRDRPFDCIGTPEEVAAALHLAAARPEWKDTAVVRALAPAHLVTPARIAELLDAEPGVPLPREYRALLDARLSEVPA